MKEEDTHWDILEELPLGWLIDKAAGSPIRNTVFITNGKSVLNGQKRALLRVKPLIKEVVEPIKLEVIEKQETKEDKKDFTFPSKTVNELARKRFLEQILKDIMFDLTVCEIEQWDKKEYIKEIKKLINSFDLSNKNNKNHIQGSLF